MIVSVLLLGCDDTMISDAFREVLTMLDEVLCLFDDCTLAYENYSLFVGRPSLV